MEARLKGVSIAVVVLLILMSMAGCFGAPAGEEDAQDAGKDCEVDHCIEVTIDAIECPEGYDNLHEDNVCLAYDGQIPGPTWVFQHGDIVYLKVVHKVAESVEGIEVGSQLAQRLGEARYSLHRHGVALDACHDGVAQPDFHLSMPGLVIGQIETEICDSTVGPGEDITYEFEARFPGYWHYHDHSHVFNANPVHPPIIGHEGIQRGLWGSFITFPKESSVGHVFDLHLFDGRNQDDERRFLANGGLGLDEEIQEGDRFDIIVTGLGEHEPLFPNRFWEVSLESPTGEVVGEVEVGPGVSRGLVVNSAEAGAYTWSAVRGELYRTTGEITVIPGSTVDPSENSESIHTATDSTGLSHHIPIDDADRVFFLDWDIITGKPLLEASAGQELAFIVATTGIQGSHTFHLHGHPWVDPDTGAIIDAVSMHAGDVHTFTVTAGLEEGHSGDWFYHCHLASHEFMWGILRVFPHTMVVHGGLEHLTVIVHDKDGLAVEAAAITLHHYEEVPSGTFQRSEHERRPVPATIEETAPGTYTVLPDLTTNVTGELVIESHHDNGNTIARITLLPDGSWVEKRNIGVPSGAPETSFLSWNRAHQDNNSVQPTAFGGS